MTVLEFRDSPPARRKGRPPAEVRPLSLGGSWWIGLDRHTLPQEAEKRADAMSASRIGQWIRGYPNVLY